MKPIVGTMVVGWLGLGVSHPKVVLDLRSGNRTFLFPLQGRNYFQRSTCRIQEEEEEEEEEGGGRGGGGCWSLG